jgi:hypothetical protein
MSKNLNRSKFKKCITGREYRIVLINLLYPPYWDEGLIFKGRLLSYQQRRYKTWKYSRKTQYKIKKNE